MNVQSDGSVPRHSPAPKNEGGFPMSNEGHSALVAKAVAEYPTLGYSILPGFFTEEDLAPALSTLYKTLSPPDAYVNGSAEFQESHRRSYRAGLVDWPYPSTELSLLGV